MRQFVKRYGQWIVGTCVLLIIGTMWLLRRQTIPDIAARLDTQERPVIVWGVKADTNLFGWYDIETDSLQGFDIDLARALTAEITGGRGEAQFVEVTAKTRIPLLKNGVVDAVLATMTITSASSGFRSPGSLPIGVSMARRSSSESSWLPGRSFSGW